MSFADCCAYFSSVQALKVSRAAPYAWNVPLLFLTGKYFSFLGSNQDFPPPHSIMTSLFLLLRFILLFKIFIPLIQISSIAPKPQFCPYYFVHICLPKYHIKTGVLHDVSQYMAHNKCSVSVCYINEQK